jgi:maltose alpha-D-glucosyltransferase / alpha-amylase
MLQDDPLWYKGALIYELHIRAFHDSDGDGIGDFKDLPQKLDYLQDLGITAIWLLPFYPSPLKDDGYDIADYTEINPSYGTLADFKEVLDAAHARACASLPSWSSTTPRPAPVVPAGAAIAAGL